MKMLSSIQTGVAGEYFVAAELTRRGYVSSLTLRNTRGIDILGESHYQGRLRNISAAGRSFTALLMREPTNAVDSNAVRVVAETADTVGYLSKEDAVYYAPVFALLDQHNRVGTCRAQLTGGAGAKRSFGVLLNLRR